MIEVAEKSILWLKIVTKGKQCHASMPDKGINAHRVAAHLLCELDDALHEKFCDEDPLFDPPISTFEPTKKEGNVPNVNTIPGEDVIYFDCRILHRYKVEKIMGAAKGVATKVEKKFGVRIEIEPVQLEEAAPPTPRDALVVKILDEAVRYVYKNEPKPMGIGGGTVAAIFRRNGYDAAVWAKLDEVCHQPNEYCVIDNMVNDAKVFVYIFSGTKVK
jgi:succinyl-diaminopimelate desuccinylase